MNNVYNKEIEEWFFQKTSTVFIRSKTIHFLLLGKLFLITKQRKPINKSIHL